MTTIRLDMFEVQLGSAMLIQFRTEHGIVRVLADGGVTGHAKDWVHGKLPTAIDDFQAGVERRIDLIIGTHYDADHLDGLVPIIEDTDIEIGEAWLPPVANDTEVHAADDQAGDASLLALQFASPNGDEVLEEYLKRLAETCDELAQAEHSLGRNVDVERRSFELFQSIASDDRPGTREYFARHLEDARRTLGELDDDHACDAVQELFDIPLIDDEPWFYHRDFALSAVVARFGATTESAQRGVRSIAYIRKSTAKRAITATSLHAVVKALKARDLPIRCAIIDDATPRRFVWDGEARRFRPSAGACSDGPELLLLGPSKSLVKKHWDRLPIGSYARFSLASWLPTKNVTPSNQLSYVAKLTFAGQNILLTGDAGFVDFRPKRSRTFHPAMLAALDDLHVVQVAHHAGANAFFYNALLAAPFAKQETECLLLLSHATDDIHRPSDEFARFMEQLDRPQPWIRLLFTCRPLEKFVRDFKTSFAPVRGPSLAEDDVRLSFSGGSWSIDRHAVAVP
jgi:hypothetical protein